MTTKKRKRQRTVYVGIDPGISGAIAIMNEKRKIIYLTKLPSTKRFLQTLTKKGNAKSATRTCEAKLHAFFTKLKKTGARVVVCIEHITPQGGPKAIGLAVALHSMAIAQALCFAFGFSYELVDPKIWQAHFYKVPKGTNTKEMSLQSARRRYPEIRKQLQTGGKQADGYADAAHMADYIRQKTLLAA